MKYLALSVLLLCSMSLSLSAAVSGGVKARLYSLAETKGYGYKTANLTLLQEELPRLNKQLAKSTRYTVAVPAFVGISSEEIHSFLLHYVGINLQELWKKLPTDSADWIADALASKKMPEEVMLTIDKIAEFIDIKCNEFIAQNKLICKKLFPSTVKLIDHIKGKKETACMVRSTGREDTQELANAGGNKSVVNVPINNTKAILHAIKEVLLSYMSAKSLNQRLCDGDATVADVPFLPILVQRMIGEKDESAFIPRCGVMFTEEAEGHVSKDFRSGITIIQAAYGHNELVVNSLGPVDTYFIDADAQKYSVIRHKQARLKPQLQAGLIEITNEAPYAPPQGAVLDQNAVLALKMVANELEAIYGIPMDVEFTLVEEAGKKVVYILQARPINHKKNENAPAYLDLNNPDVQTMPQMKCQVVGAGGGSLRCINALKLWKGAGASPIKAFDQVIAAPTISMAYAAYDACLDKDKINLIIIGTMAPSTSHEATFFRGLRKPVIAVSDFERIKKWLKEPEYALVIDAQQQLIVQLNNDFKSRVSSHLSAFRASAAGLVSPLPVLEEHTSPVDFGDSILAGESQFGPDDIYSGAGVGAGYKTPTKRPSPLRSTSSAGAGRSEDSPLGLKSPVTDIGILRQDFLVDQGLARVGWISYPLPKELSLNVQKSLPIKILSLDKLVFFNDDHKKRAHTQLAIAIKSKNFTSYIKQQILLAKTAEELQAKEALSNLWQLFFVTPKKVKIDQTRYNQILMQAAALVQSILNGIKVPQSDPAYLSKRLFPIHWLETLIFQQHKDDDLLYADSLVSLWADGGIVKKSSADLVDEPVLPAGSKVTAEHLEALNMLRQHALTDEIALKWTSFIKTLTSCVNDASDPDAAGPAGGGAGAGGSDKPVDRGGEVKEFFENIKRLGSLNALPLWLNTSFAEKERPSLTLFNREITEAGDFLTALEEYKNKLSSVSLNGFSDPSTFFKHWHNFQQNIVNYFLDDTENGFKSSFCEANALGKRVAITLMERLIDTFDTVIKSVTGSILFEVIDDLPRRQTHAKILKNSLLSVAQVQKHKDKIFTYYFMLHLYIKLLEQFYQLLLDVDLSLAPFGETLAEDVIEAVVNILNLNPRSNCKNQLIIRPKFNVLGSILGSGCNFARIVELDPVLEEIFIFTHQSFLAIIRKLTEKYGVNVAMLPVNLQKMHHQILAMQTTISDDLAYSGRKLITQYAQHVGTELAKGTCKLSYILPQRGHAIQMVLVYDYIKKDYSFDCLIYGGNEYARWDICAEYIKKMSADCDITVVCSAEDKQCSASWSLGVDPSVNMHHLVSMLLKCCEIADVDNQNANIDIICMFIRQISVPERMEYLQLITRPLSIAEINSLFAALENITTLSIEELQARNVSRNNLDTIVKKIIEPLYNSSLRPHPLAENQRVILAKISERIIKLIENFMLAQRTKRFPGQEFGWLEDPFK